MLHRVLCAVFVLVFVACIAVQYNDPDGFSWMLIYGAGLSLTVLHLFRPRLFTPQVIGAVGSLAGALFVLFTVENLEADKILASFEMQGLGVEEFREAVGLAIQGAWLTYLAAAAWSKHRADSDQPS